jgi:hypothetical protein
MPRLVIPALAFAALCGSSAVATAAPVFDADAYTTCTATTVPAPGQDFDAVVTSCCVQHAGVPAPTNYGMGCVAPMDGAPTDDERPVIVMPMRPTPPDQADSDLNDLIDMPLPDPLP